MRSPTMSNLLQAMIMQETAAAMMNFQTSQTVVDRSMASGMEVSTEKSKVMANSTNDISTGISMNDQKMEELISFKYLGATLCKDSTLSLIHI